MGDRAGIWEEMRCPSLGRRGGCGEGGERGTNGLEKRDGEELVGPQGLSQCTGCGERRQPRSPRHCVGPSDTYIPVLRNTATKMKTRPLWSTARPTSPTR